MQAALTIIVASVSAQLTPENVEHYVSELKVHIHDIILVQVIRRKTRVQLQCISDCTNKSPSMQRHLHCLGLLGQVPIITHHDLP